MELEIVLNPTHLPKPSQIVDQVFTQNAYLVRKEPQKSRKDGFILLYFPSTEVIRMEPESTKPSSKRRVRGSKTLSPPQHVTICEPGKTCWAIPQYQGGIQFQMSLNQKQYLINLDVNNGTVTKFDFFEGLRGAQPKREDLVKSRKMK